MNMHKIQTFSGWVSVFDGLPNNPTQSERLSDIDATAHRQEIIVMMTNGDVRTALFETIVCDDPYNPLHNTVRLYGQMQPLNSKECTCIGFNVDEISHWLPLPNGAGDKWISIFESNPELGYTPENLRAIIAKYKLRDWQTLNIIKMKGRNNLGRYRTDVGMENHDDMPHEKWLLLIEYVRIYDEWKTTNDPIERDKLGEKLFQMRGGDKNPNPYKWKKK